MKSKTYHDKRLEKRSKEFVVKVSPEFFFDDNNNVRPHLLDVTKSFYENLKRNDFKPTLSSGLPQLFTRGFDLEQIFSQIEKYQKPLLKHLNMEMDSLEKSNNKDKISLIKHRVKLMFEKEAPSVLISSNTIVSNKTMHDETKVSSKSDETFENFVIDDSEKNVNNYWNFIEQDLEAIDKLEGTKENSLEVLYNNRITDPPKKINSEIFDEDETSSDSDDDSPIENKTLFEREQERLLQEIEEMETERMGTKKWQEMGEINKNQRPHESLLHEDLSFTSQIKPRPLITQEKTEDLEAIILSRIMNKEYDDPIDHIEKPMDDKKEIVELNKVRDRKGLDEIYEEEYRRVLYGEEGNEEENERNKKIKEKIERNMSSVMHTLNAMSSFNYIQPPAITEDDIDDVEKTVEKNLKSGTRYIPSISLEESVQTVQNVNMDVNLNEPKKIMKPIRRMQIGENEMNKKDRERKRRSIKESHKKRRKLNDNTKVTF